ncbi:DUF4199 domain-containing protein [Marivirga arenosa]|uniref:DUF4199 domain-containing protein n=1 Tax=Marivirga arenosa TaxID=3059076 RepID=A0AA49JE06_9BACT|nr:DUF4199 domain-containing protein [Marivirga sp. ABR2-2]WKK85950.2 DUF4199 domain-containing protein [Marivirga sp. ABR2-2]
MENQEVEVNNTQHSLKWGAILGLISVIITLVIYMIDITIMASSARGIISFVIYVAIVIYAGRDYRSKVGGYMSFKDAFLHSFVVLSVSGFIGVVFNILLFTVIDPEAANILIDVTMENTMKSMEVLGGASNEIMDEMAKGIREGYSVVGQAQGYLYLLIFYAIGALIIGAINKKKNQEEEF